MLVLVLTSVLLLLLRSASCTPAPRTQQSNPKRGLALVSPGDIQKVSGGIVSWEYNWAVAPPSNTDGLEHVPMQWGTQDIASFASAVEAQNAKIILGFNEPDLTEQSNISPTDAASLWQEYIQPLKAAGVRLGSPAISAASSGTVWLSQFIQACHGCNIDFIAIHWYGTGAQNFINYLVQVHQQFPQYSIWVTEFAETSLDGGVVQSFLETTTSYMDSQSWVERYSWFSFSRSTPGLNTNLLDSNGNLNTLGKLYVD